MLVVRHPDGRILGAALFRGAPAWLDLEAKDPSSGVANAHFVLRGSAPAQTEWRTVPWGEPWSSRPIITYEHLVRPNIDFVLYLRRLAREEAARYAAIPSRRRRHDRA